MLETLDRPMVPKEVKNHGIEATRREGLAWLAGFIDGEGCFCIGFHVAEDRETPRRTFRVCIRITNTDVCSIQRASEILAENGVGFTLHLVKPKKSTWHEAITIVVQGQGRCLKACLLLLPFLSCKREQALQMIHAIRYRKSLAERNGGNNKNSALINDKLLCAMSRRMQELNAFRPGIKGFSRKASMPIKCKKPSEAIRLAAISADDMVRPA